MKPSDLQELKRLAAEATPGGWESVATRYATEKVGDVEEVKGPLRLCGAGALHATLEPGKWRGPKVWVVALYGEVIEEADKLGALKREIRCGMGGAMTELERVELMASGSPTWDLSEKDIAALRALLARLRAAEAERDEARAALVKMEEEYRAAVEALETYESRIGDIADHVLGLVPPNVPSVVKLDAIERRCGKERVAARQAEARVRELEATLAECAHEVTCAETLEQARAGVHRAAGDVTGIEEQSAPGR